MNDSNYEYIHEDAGLFFGYNYMYDHVNEEGLKPHMYYSFQSRLLHPSFANTVIYTSVEAWISYGKETPKQIYEMPHQPFDRIVWHQKIWGELAGNEFELEDKKQQAPTSILRLFTNRGDLLEKHFFVPRKYIDVYFNKATEKDIKKLFKHLDIELPEDSIMPFPKVKPVNRSKKEVSTNKNQIPPAPASVKPLAASPVEEFNDEMEKSQTLLSSLRSTKELDGSTRKERASERFP